MTSMISRFKSIVVAILWLIIIQAVNVTAEQPLPGQIVIDPDHPQWLMHHGSRHVFICGPGDPEDFLYLGKRNPDGTRDGDQVQRIEKLIEHGGNCIYMQIIRSHGGDAKDDKTQNPFLDSDPAKGLDEDILSQWEEWFTLMDSNGILIYLFFYDDGARIWNTGDGVGPEEQAFVGAVVQRFKHHKNVIWIIGEESEERYTAARVQAIAEVIRQADDHGHPIGNHHLTGTTFKAWQPGGALNHFAMQLSQTDEQAHAGAIEALQKAAGRYQIIYSESTAMRTDVDSMRRHAWAVAMGGLMPMLLGMDIINTPAEALQQCRHLQTFFEGTDFATMSPHDELAHGETKYVLADPGQSYIAYVDNPASKIGLKNLAAGHYALTWLDCVTGATVTGEADVQRAAVRSFTKPQAIGPECALWIRVADASETTAYFPPPESQGGWRKLENPTDVRRIGGMDPDKLAEVKQWLLESDRRDFAAVVIRNGHIVLEVERGNSAKTDSRRVASVSKAVCATVLAIASELSQQGGTPRKMSFTDPAVEFIPWAQPLSDPRKAQVTVQQLFNTTSGLCPESTGASNNGTWDDVLGHTDDARLAQLAFDPGSGSGYSTHAIYHAALVCENVTGKPYDQFAIEHLFRPIGCERWWFQYFDSPKHGRRANHAMGMPARDLARIAYCMLRQGSWNGRQVIPQWFVKDVAQGPTHALQGVKELRWGRDATNYSHAWELPTSTTTAPEPWSEHIPRDARFKRGSGGQFIAYVPSLDFVVTRQTGGSGQWEYEEYLGRVCLAATQAASGSP